MHKYIDDFFKSTVFTVKHAVVMTLKRICFFLFNGGAFLMDTLPESKTVHDCNYEHYNYNQLKVAIRDELFLIYNIIKQI